MSLLQFIKTPFPDNHDGFDYAPKSFMEQKAEIDSVVRDHENEQRKKNLLSMIASIFK